MVLNFGSCGDHDALAANTSVECVAYDFCCGVMKIMKGYCTIVAREIQKFT